MSNLSIESSASSTRAPRRFSILRLPAQALSGLRSLLAIVLVCFVGGVASVPAHATVVTSIYVPNVGYRYVDVVPTTSGAEVWFRVYSNACSFGDRKAAVLTRAVQTLSSAKQTICTLKPYYDWGNFALGCGSVVGSAVCIAATVPSGGTAAAACGTVLTYGLTTGYLQCLNSVSDIIGTYLAGSSYYPIAIQTALSTGQIGSAISSSIDWACTHPY